MPEFVLDHGGETARFQSLPEFVQGYIEAMFFTECHCENPELESATFADLSPDSLVSILEDCAAFRIKAGGLIAEAEKTPGYDEQQAGRDFWYTRNHHGVGFWDRPELEPGGIGDRLTYTADSFREVYLCRGDDGLIHHE